MQPQEIDRREFLKLASIGVGAAAFSGPARSPQGEELPKARTTSDGKPVLRIERDLKKASISVLSWDTESGDKAQTNLLRANASLDLRVRIGGVWKTFGKDGTCKDVNENGEIAFALIISAATELSWTIRHLPEQITMTVTGSGGGLRDIEAVEMFFPFDPMVTPTTILPQTWTDDRCGRLPAVVSSPDFGQILLEESHPGVRSGTSVHVGSGTQGGLSVAQRSWSASSRRRD